MFTSSLCDLYKAPSNKENARHVLSLASSKNWSLFGQELDACVRKNTGLVYDDSLVSYVYPRVISEGESGAQVYVKRPKDRSKRKEFEHEVIVAREVNKIRLAGCPNFPLLLTDFESASNRYMVYENAGDACLWKFTQTMPFEQTIPLLFQTLTAIDYAQNEFGFRHNDLHAANVMIREKEKGYRYRLPYSGDWMECKYFATIIDFNESTIRRGNSYIHSPKKNATRYTSKQAGKVPLYDAFRLLDAIYTEIENPDMMNPYLDFFGLEPYLEDESTSKIWRKIDESVKEQSVLDLIDHFQYEYDMSCIVEDDDMGN